MRKFNRHQNIVYRIIIITAASGLLIFFAGSYKPADLISAPAGGKGNIEQMDELSSGKSVYFVSRTMDKWNSFYDKASAKAENLNLMWSGSGKTEGYSPSVLRYNLVKAFPDPSDEEEAVKEISGELVYSVFSNPRELMDLILKPLYKKLDLPVKNKVRDSYGGQMYEYLNRKDAQWASDLYKWIQATPEKAASMKSGSAAAVLGKYNPNNPKHIPEDPSTWLIPWWKNVSVSFYDGDGKHTELYSNTQEILSMASVNTYYSDWRDIEQFKQYAGSLWDASHSYSTQIGPVYYCSGCEMPQEILSEDGAQEGTQEGESEAGVALGPGTSESSPSVAPQSSTAAADTPPVAAQMAETVPDSGSSGSVQDVSENIQDIAAAPVSAIEMIPPSVAESTAAGGNHDGDLAAAVRETAAHTDTQTTQAQAVPVAEDTVNGPAAVITSGEMPADLAVPVQGGEVSPSVSTEVENVPMIPELQLNAEGKFCSGHVDLFITARITGLSERKNLFTLDKAASKPWTAYMKSYVYELNSMDWNEKYGLSAMELGMGTPLTSSEIAEYLSMMPEDTSPERKAVVAYALNSVGKIPYYYGGKPRAEGYENNDFSTPTLPDQSGRVLSGLDCSGWIYWVYWSSIGKPLGALGTSGQIHEGRAISRSELKPGDILVKPGLNSHVVMFLSWTSDNNMICIHETGGNISNVTVSTMGTSWPYYRALLD